MTFHGTDFSEKVRTVLRVSIVAQHGRAEALAQEETRPAEDHAAHGEVGGIPDPYVARNAHGPDVERERQLELARREVEVGEEVQAHAPVAQESHAAPREVVRVGGGDQALLERWREPEWRSHRVCVRNERERTS